LSRKKTKQWRQGVVITVCSKDRFKSQFLGQIQIPFDTAAAEIYHNASTVVSLQWLEIMLSVLMFFYF
jgi:hypothetical protein